MTKKQQKKCFVSAAILMTAIIAHLLFCGCAQQYGQRNPDDTVYSAQFAYSDVEYTMYVNRELDPVTNALSANLMLARNTANQEYQEKTRLPPRRLRSTLCRQARKTSMSCSRQRDMKSIVLMSCKR